MREADGEFGQCGVFEGYLDGGVPNASFGQMVGGGRGRDSHLEEFPGSQLGGQWGPAFMLGWQEVGKTQLFWSQAEN